jgi:hypothetical protein
MKPIDAKGSLRCDAWVYWLQDMHGEASTASMPTLEYMMRDEIAAQLRMQLSTNRDLRQCLLAHPKTVIAAEFDVDLPAELHVAVVENTAGQHYLLLPAQARQPMVETQPGAAREFEEVVSQRALQDAAFHAQLVADPKGTLETLLHFKLPADVRITVLEETPQTWYLVCPPLTDLLVDELQDQELEAVAGGASSTTYAPNSCAANEGFRCKKKSATGNKSTSFHRPRYPICH